MRTTLDIDAPILRNVKKLGKAQGKPLGRAVSDLLAQALHQVKASARLKPEPFVWTAKSMSARVDLGDREAIWAAIDRDRARSASKP